jgi:hypothetical protein
VEDAQTGRIAEELEAIGLLLQTFFRRHVFPGAQNLPRVDKGDFAKISGVII